MGGSHDLPHKCRRRTFEGVVYLCSMPTSKRTVELNEEDVVSWRTAASIECPWCGPVLRAAIGTVPAAGAPSGQAGRRGVRATPRASRGLASSPPIPSPPRCGNAAFPRYPRNYPYPRLFLFNQ